MLRISAKWHTTDSNICWLINIKRTYLMYEGTKGHIATYQQAIFDLALGVYSQITH